MTALKASDFAKAYARGCGEASARLLRALAAPAAVAAVVAVVVRELRRRRG
jgi:hypothetical protein